MLSNETFEDATTSGTYQNFSLHSTDDYKFLGVIFPPLGDEWYWPLDDPGDTNALEYNLEGGSFSIKFRLRQSLRNPTDYEVFVWGFIDHTRTPYVGKNVDLIGYARIRTN